MDKEICSKYCYRKVRSKPVVNKKDMDRLKLVVFDMDGVLVDVHSSWSFVHDFFNTSNERSVKDYLRGEIDDLEFIRRDVSLWKVDGEPLKREVLFDLLSKVRIMNGAEKTVSFLKENNVKTAIVSAGIDVLAKRIGKELGIDFVYSNAVLFDDYGFVSGEGRVGVSLMYKDKAVFDISKKLGIDVCNVLSVGNSCLDVPMFEVSGVGVAFNPSDSCVCEAADYVVRKKDLGEVVPIFERYL